MVARGTGRESTPSTATSGIRAVSGVSRPPGFGSPNSVCAAHLGEEGAGTFEGRSPLVPGRVPYKVPCSSPLAVVTVGERDGDVFAWGESKLRTQTVPRRLPTLTSLNTTGEAKRHPKDTAKSPPKPGSTCLTAAYLPTEKQEPPGERHVAQRHQPPRRLGACGGVCGSRRTRRTAALSQVRSGRAAE